MLFAIVGLWGLIVLACFFFAEFNKELKVIGFFGGALLIVLGLMIATSPIQIQTAVITTNTQSQTLNGWENQTGNTTATFNFTSNITTTIYNLSTLKNETTNLTNTQNITDLYSNIVYPISFSPYDLGQILGVILMLTGVLASLYYALNLIRSPNPKA